MTHETKPGEYPHVTTILSQAALADTRWFRDFDRERGIAVHQATHFLDESDLDIESLDPAVRPRVEQYSKFRLEMDPTIHHIEMPVISHIYRYQGKLDRIVTIKGECGVLDIKGPSTARWQGVQLAAYEFCARTHMQSKSELVRWTLHLADDKYRLVRHTDRNDWEVFKAALTIAHWKAQT